MKTRISSILKINLTLLIVLFLICGCSRNTNNQEKEGTALSSNSTSDNSHGSSSNDSNSEVDTVTEEVYRKPVRRNRHNEEYHEYNYERTKSTDLEYEKAKEPSSYVYNYKRVSTNYPHEYYEVPLPDFDFNVNLEEKSLFELRILRNEVFARHGYLFKNSVLRGYYNHVKWYHPNFWDKDFEIKLSSEEIAFVNRVKSYEKKLLENNYHTVGEYKLANIDNVVNFSQVSLLPKKFIDHLEKNNFVIQPPTTNRYSQIHRSLWELYDSNHYYGVPSFITTDLYLEILHKHYKYLIVKLEATEFIPKLENIVTTLLNESTSIYNREDKSTELENALEYNIIYLTIASNLLFKDQVGIPEELKFIYDKELAKVKEQQGLGSAFLDYNFFDYTELKPRGHYNSDPLLKRYFTCMKWLLNAPFMLDNDSSSMSAITMAWMMNNNAKLASDYHIFDRVLGALIGEGDDLALTDLITLIMNNYDELPIEKLLRPEKAKEIIADFGMINIERIKAKSVLQSSKTELERKHVHFFPARYTFDGDILQTLVKAKLRPVPKGIDVFAALGNKEAEDILLNEYKVADNWPEYVDTLKKLKIEMSNENIFTSSIYNARMDALSTMLKIEDYYPPFMQTKAWARKNLHTCMSGWTQLKHENSLYMKKPFFAEGGEGGGPPPPPPVVPGYVEPNIGFWKKCMELIDRTQKVLSDNDISYATTTNINGRLFREAEFLYKVSLKELNNEELTDDDFNKISRFGGSIEHIYRSIKSSCPIKGIPENDKLPIVTDVYTHLGQGICLEEAVGHSHPILVVVEINGLLYLTRGSVMSYYEFLQPISNRLTDEEWRKSGATRKHPVWIQDYIEPSINISFKPEYNPNLFRDGMRK
jgi:Protein of unknown function (DUF3160)/YARHG domain